LSVAAAKAAARGAAIDFIHGDARRLPFADAAFDAIVCVGSTLSLIVKGWPLALAEMARVLKPGGRLLLEVEQRWNLDLLWALADSLLGGPLGYEQPLTQSLRNIFASPRRGIDLSYPLPTGDGTLADLTIHCFTLSELRAACAALGVRIKRLWGLHAVTNLLPSTLLHDERLSLRWRRIARALGRLDARLSGIAPFNRLGCSQVLSLEKHVAPAGA
ncbi:MAG TPA: class I SAM-dependent methyltransferase, partial [Pirellulales bacterium]|nr:class I SAM-dependent methyltransferase [Pirellulales bacterium]